MALVTLPVQELNAFDLPPVCMITGAPAEGFKPVKFSWYPRWVPALILVPYGGLLLAIIVSYALRKKAAGELPFSTAGFERYTRTRWIAATAALWLIGGVMLGLGAIAMQQAGAGAALFVLGFVGTIAAVVYSGRAGIAVHQITDTHITLKIPSEAAAAAIQAHLHSGVIPAAAVA